LTADESIDARVRSSMKMTTERPRTVRGECVHNLILLYNYSHALGQRIFIFLAEIPALPRGSLLKETKGGANRCWNM